MSQSAPNSLSGVLNTAVPDLQTLFEIMTLGVLYQDATGRITSANPAAERAMGMTLNEMRGCTYADLRLLVTREDGIDMPTDEYPSAVALRTRQSARDVTMGIFHPSSHETRWLRVNATPEFRDGEVGPFRVCTLFEDITDWRAADLALQGIGEAFINLDRKWRFSYLNASAEQMLSRTRAGLLGRSIWDEFPETIGTVSDREYHRALEEQLAVEFEQYYPRLGKWFAVRASPSHDGLSVFFQDITEHKNEEGWRAQHGQYEQFLAELDIRAKRLTDPDAVIADALRSVGKFLGVSRCVFVDIDIEADICISQPDYRADTSVVSIEGTFPISAFGAVVVAEYGAGRAVAVDDVHANPTQVPPENIATYDAVGIRAHVSVPVVHSNRLVSCIGAHSASPRHWKPDEVDLLKAVVERTWLNVEVLRQERALSGKTQERLETLDRMARLLESISDGFFALDHEWRFTYVNAQAEQILSREREDILGRSLWDAYPEIVGSDFEREYRHAISEQIPVSFEAYYPTLSLWFEVRAYPSDDGLSIFFQAINERKEAEKVAYASLERLLLGEQRLRLALESGQLSSYELDLSTDEFCSPTASFKALFGLGPEDAFTRAISVRAVHPDDRASIREAHAERRHTGSTVFVDFRVLWPDGSEHWLRSHALVISADGQSKRMIGATQDITERKVAEAALTEATQRQRTMLRDILASVTSGRLHLVESGADLPAPLPEISESIPLTASEGLWTLRQRVKEVALGQGFKDERWQGLVSAASEGGMNAIVHGGGLGSAQVSTDGNGHVQVRVQDWGSGISMENLPNATLARGWSSTTSLGHGMVMMLEMIDRMYLLTGQRGVGLGPAGTTLVIEQEREEPPPAWLI